MDQSFIDCVLHKVMLLCEGRRGLVVMAAGWLSLDASSNPISARIRWRPRGVAWDAVPEP